MTTSCREFRALLELVLEGGAVERSLSELAWHEHLLACGECRNLLQAEEALEILLATLPEPKLPEHLARRVISRLRDARKADSRLDALLDLDRTERAPDRLAASVLARLRPERERSAETVLAAAEKKLDRLLDLDREIEAPAGLAQRVLAGLQSERTLTAGPSGRAKAAHHRREPVLARDVVPTIESKGGAKRGPHVLRSPWLYAAAAGILATLIGWTLWQRALGTAPDSMKGIAQGDSSHPSDDRSISTNANGSGRELTNASQNRVALGAADRVVPRDADAPPEAGMLAALDVLEQWDLLKSDDVDVLLSSSIDPADEALLEYQDAESTAPTLKEKEPEPRSKG
jgi:hypothetical protein